MSPLPRAAISFFRRVRNHFRENREDAGCISINWESQSTRDISVKSVANIN